MKPNSSKICWLGKGLEKSWFCWLGQRVIEPYGLSTSHKQKYRGPNFTAGLKGGFAIPRSLPTNLIYGDAKNIGIIITDTCFLDDTVTVNIFARYWQLSQSELQSRLACTINSILSHNSPGAKMGTWKCLRVQGFMIDPESIGVLKEIKLGCHDGNLGELFLFA